MGDTDRASDARPSEAGELPAPTQVLGEGVAFADAAQRAAVEAARLRLCGGVLLKGGIPADPPEGFSVSWLRGFRQWRALKLGQDDLFSALETVLASPEDPSGDVRTLAVEEAVHNETGEDLEAWAVCPFAGLAQWRLHVGTGTSTCHVRACMSAPTRV